MNVSQREPVALGYLVTVLVNAVLLVVSAFNVYSLTTEQTAAVHTGATAIVALFIAWKTRSVVYSPATIATAKLDAELPGV